MEALTPQETEVAKLIARGMSTDEIAEALSRSHWTIRAHERHIRRKAGITNDRALALWAARNVEAA